MGSNEEGGWREIGDCLWGVMGGGSVKGETRKGIVYGEQ